MDSQQSSFPFLPFEKQRSGVEGAASSNLCPQKVPVEWGKGLPTRVVTGARKATLLLEVFFCDKRKRLTFIEENRIE